MPGTSNDICASSRGRSYRGMAARADPRKKSAFSLTIEKPCDNYCRSICPLMLPTVE